MQAHTVEREFERRQQRGSRPGDGLRKAQRAPAAQPPTPHAHAHAPPPPPPPPSSSSAPQEAQLATAHKPHAAAAAPSATSFEARVHEQTKRLLVAANEDALERARELQRSLDRRDIFGPLVNEMRALHEMRVSVQGRHLSLDTSLVQVRLLDPLDPP